MQLFGWKLVRAQSPEWTQVGVSDLEAGLVSLGEDIGLLRRDLNRIEKRVYRGKADVEPVPETVTSDSPPMPALADTLSKLRSGDVPPSWLYGGGEWQSSLTPPRSNT